MGKYFRKWYRSPRTRNEAKQNQEGWCRAKRRPTNLPDPWDDRPRGHQKNWKKFRKTKYRPEHRGKQHTLVVTDWREAWALQEYCTEHGIPYRQEEIKTPYRTQRVPIKKAEIIGQKPIYIEKYTRVYNVITGEYEKKKVRTLWFYTPIYSYKITGYRMVTYYYTKGYTCTWWSDKDIGVEYILRNKNR